MTIPERFVLSAACIIISSQTGQAGDHRESTSLELNSKLDLSGPTRQIWVADIGDGFQKETHEIGLSIGGALGMRRLAGVLNHDLALASIRYGWTMSGVLGGSHWYHGNWELIGEFFGGGQYNPSGAYVLGATPLMRYNVATGTRWIPFAEAGFGPAFTDISRPDLSSKFEFNIQSGVGAHYFWNEHQAITMQWRYLHISNAGVERPNIGVNDSIFMIGTTWFF